MNYLDIVLILLLLIFLIRGFIRGLFIELASVLALIAGIWGAIKFSDFAGKQLAEIFSLSEFWMGLLAFVVTFVFIAIGVHLVAKVADKLFSAIALGWLIKILGGFCGLIKGLVIISLLLVFLNAIDARASFLPHDKINESILYNPVSKILPAIFPLVAEGNLSNSSDKLKNQPQE